MNMHLHVMFSSLGIFIHFMNFPLDQRFCHMHAVRFCIYDQNWNVYGLWYHTRFGWSVGWLIICSHSFVLRSISVIFGYCFCCRQSKHMRAFIHHSCCLQCLKITKWKQRKIHHIAKMNAVFTLCSLHAFLHLFIRTRNAIKWAKFNGNASWHATKRKRQILLILAILTISNR